MAAASWFQLLALVALIVAGTRVLGPYVANVYDGSASRADKVFGPVERRIYRLCGIDEEREQRWNTYALSLLAFSLVSVLLLFAIQRLQGSLPFNPDGFGAVPVPLAWNTAVSFVTNTNWQNYAGETTMSPFTQMVGLAVQNFVSPVVGLCVAMALVRALARRRAGTIGNFWVDLVRGTLRIMVPLCIVVGLVLISQGAIQNLHGFTTARTLQGATQAIPGGPFASQEAVKMLGTNGGGTLNANSMHPFANANGFTDLLQIFSLLLIPFAVTFSFGRMIKDQRQGWVLFATMMVLWLGAVALATGMEVKGNPELRQAGVTQVVTATQGGGNMEGKEVRFGSAGCGVFAASTTGTSTGAVNCAHDSMTPLGGMAPLANMMLGEVSPGGVGAGLYGILVFALLGVFIAGLMVGRTPEYLGKKIQAAEMKLVVLYIVAVPFAVLGFTAASLVTGNKASILNPGPHGLSEVAYGFTSAGNNNGSAFGGLAGATDWYNTTLGLSMLIGRFLLIVPVLAIAGSLARKQRVPASSGTFPTGTPLFAGLLTGVILIVVGLTYFPVLALGPIVEHLGLS
ncbi:potassium-transporting ATPase subunit KdpA [Aquihabitans sp. G128]|uniref:potassium-transporting ATPase subunit KdpA n=1 Tax=Aquihabitans sp. G128 TaxID=2849779 RepID=UPI001C21255B|nr:potassium-transporting ATPase subunit KdpA [Aquihabitans sp. G128]QXC59795.1 potassium-transporting ATPase subunit KdpA [Aquihabitans sp. G128]